MASQGASNRHFLLCPVCKKTQATLSVHLRRVCMKDATPEAISEVVEKAKTEVHEILVSGRVFHYVELLQIMDSADPLSRLIEELQRRHMVVTNLPTTLARAEPQPSTSEATQPAVTGVMERDMGPESGESDAPSTPSSGETFQCTQDPRPKKWRKATRKLMAEKGLYKKHSLDHPLLKGFANHLMNMLCIENFKQEVENVARFLFYMDPQAPSLEFVRNREKVQEYLMKLTDAKLTKQTQLNYLKNLKRFLQYHTVNTNLRHSDAELHADSVHFIAYIGTLQKTYAKMVSKEITQRRHDMLIDKSVTVSFQRDGQGGRITIELPAV